MPGKHREIQASNSQISRRFAQSIALATKIGVKFFAQLLPGKGISVIAGFVFAVFSA